MDRLTTTTPKNKIHEQFKSIKSHFNTDIRGNLRHIITIAQSIKEEIALIDPFIQQNTSVVCSECEKVCCINRHGYYEQEDIIYLSALNEGLPDYKDDAYDEQPCQFLSTNGCYLPRYRRPFRCNWYFCVTLINYMQTQRGKDYRRFESHLKNIVDYRKMLIDIYENGFCR